MISRERSRSLMGPRVDGRSRSQREDPNAPTTSEGSLMGIGVVARTALVGFVKMTAATEATGSRATTHPRSRPTLEKVDQRIHRFLLRTMPHPSPTTT